ncbi:MAG: hypothetical protein AAF604_18145, partial [Acidobacteriota bacterium]
MATLANPVPEIEPLPRIEAVAGEFRLAATGERLTPRGNNYVRLSSTSPRYHSTFGADYDPQAIEMALSTMAVFGYNIVRVFIDPGNWNRETGINGPWETGHLDEAYLDHFADFLL